MSLVTRQQWGARPPYSVTPIASSEGIFVHYTVTPTGPDEASIVRGVQAYHMDNKGWRDIAYSFLVGQSGNVYEGRGWGVAGGHTEGWNSRSHAVCWIGNTETPSDAALAAINEVCAEHARRYGGFVKNHRDVNSTSCPGDKLSAWVNSGRQTTTNPPPPPPTEQDWFDMATAEELRTIVAEEVRAQCWHEAGTDRIWLAEPGGVWRRWISGPAEFDALTAYRGCRVVWNVPTDVCQALEDVGNLEGGFTLTVEEVQKIPGAVAAELALRLS